MSVSDPVSRLWYLILEKNVPYSIPFKPTSYVVDVKALIKEQNANSLKKVDAPDLTLWMPLAPIPLEPFQTLGSRTLDLWSQKGASQHFLELGSSDLVVAALQNRSPDISFDNCVDILVEVPAEGSPSLVQITDQEKITNVDGVQIYKDIFVKVKNWRRFEMSDIEGNEIVESRGTMAPDFVTTFEGKLVRKPRFPPNIPALQMHNIPETYFDLSEGESQGETRHADFLEVTHTAYHIAPHDWNTCWAARGSHRKPLKEHFAKSIFFDVFILNARAQNRTATVLQDQSSPIPLIVEREGVDRKKELRQYHPYSDFLISNSDLPRLLVEVNSTSQKSWPTDLVRMLTTGAFIVRFANKFASAFQKEKNFVLCAFFIWDDGQVARYILFQEKQNDRVCYRMMTTSLNSPIGRVEFARHLYNILCEESEQDQDLVKKIGELCRRISAVGLKSMSTAPTGDGTGEGASGKNTGKKHRRGNKGGPADGGSVDDCAQLSAYGYQVEPDVFVDESGGEWERLPKNPDHILIVYRPADPNQRFIAKKVREGSDELEILRLLDTIPHKFDHVISLIESFRGWAILPNMATVEGYVYYNPEVFDSKVCQVCLGLIKGVAFLHEHGIAHRDIKLDNLVVDENFCLKVIDFDIAIRVEDEDEEIDERCGTRDWMAPEVVKNLKHSPIRADRWACGRVLLFLLDRFGKEDKCLRAFARDLVANNPKQRPSLLEWDRYSASELSDIDNIRNVGVDTRKVLRPRRDPEGENMEPPDAKKQRLDGLDQYDKSGAEMVLA